ncbi:hypothetical protein [Actinomadura napierensis]
MRQGPLADHPEVLAMHTGRAAGPTPPEYRSSYGGRAGGAA